MSETDDKRELSGLARSIDALFSSPARGRPSQVALAPEPLEGLTPQLPEEPELPEELEIADFGGLADEPVATDLAVAPEEPTVPPPLEVTLPPQALDLPEAMESLEALEVPRATEAAAEDEHATAPGAPSAVTEVPSGDAPEDDFVAAVDAFLAGEQGAAARVRDGAAELSERMALDPLADAVERLARSAGDPPDPTLLDMAGEIMNPAVASRIVQRIGREDDEARLAEYTTLCRRLGIVMAKSFRGALTGATDRETRRKYHDVLIAMSETCRPIIEEMVEDENTLLVRSGVAILGDIGGDNAAALVTSALANSDARVRREALLSLGKLRDEESGALVMASLEDPERDVRVAAATAAGALGLERALRPILAQLEAEGDGEGAIPFIDALGELGDPGAVPAIEKHAVKTLFSKPRTEVRIAAYRALQKIGTPHARDLVQKALDAKEPGIWAAVRQIVADAATE